MGLAMTLFLVWLCSSGSSGSWVDELSEEVLNTVSTQLRKWTDVIQTLGMDADRLKQYIEIYKGNVEQLVTEMTEEMDMLQEKVVNDIRKLLEKSATLCKELDLQMPEYGQENLGLYKEKAILMEKVAE